MTLNYYNFFLPLNNNYILFYIYFLQKIMIVSQIFYFNMYNFCKKKIWRKAKYNFLFTKNTFNFMKKKNNFFFSINFLSLNKNFYNYIVIKKLIWFFLLNKNSSLIFLINTLKLNGITSFNFCYFNVNKTLFNVNYISKNKKLIFLNLTRL